MSVDHEKPSGESVGQESLSPANAKIPSNSTRRTFNRRATGAAVLLTLGSQGAWAGRQGAECMSAAVWASFNNHTASYGPGAGRQAQMEARRFREFERGREYRRLFRRTRNGREQFCYRTEERDDQNQVTWWDRDD